jgi:hypothetical protein
VSISFTRHAPALAHVTRKDVHDLQDDWTAPLGGLHSGREYSKVHISYLEQRRREEEKEIEARHKVILQGITDEYAQKVAYLRALEQKIRKLINFLVNEIIAATRDSVDELKARLAAATLELELIQNDLLVLAPYAPA